MAEIDSLCEQLGRIAALLEKGDAEAAAAILPDMKETLAARPVGASPEQIAAAQALLGRCAVLEQDLRNAMMASFQRLGAVRKSRVYRLR
jgi:hypothetical protein